MHWLRTFLPTSSGVQWACPFSEQQGCGYNLHNHREVGTVPSWNPNVAPLVHHLGQPLLTSDPPAMGSENSPPSLGNEHLMLFIHLEIGSF